MRRTTLAAAAALAVLSTAATAANVELYGVVDTGFTYTHSGDADIDTFEMSTGNYAGSRWGASRQRRFGQRRSRQFLA